MLSKRKIHTSIIICLSCLLFAAVTGCATQTTSPEYADNPIAQRDTLVQISTIDALLNGVYDGVMTFGTLKEYGDFGIGTFEALDGEMVGFRCPAYVSAVNVVGYHLHFLTKDEDAGEHVLEFNVAKAVAYVDYTSEFLMILPGEDSDFYSIDMAQDKQEELEKVEK